MSSASVVRPVLCIGETLIDLIASDGAVRLRDVDAFVVRPGGAPANVAVALARLGVASAFCGVVGADPFGERLRATLAAEGVDVSRLRSTDAAETTLAFAWKDERGDGNFRLLRMADRLLSAEDITNANIAQTAAVVLGSVSMATEPSREAAVQAVTEARRSDIPVCFDVNMRSSLWTAPAAALLTCEPLFQRATLLKMSLDDGRALFPGVTDANGLLDAVRRYPARFVIVTDGERGAWFVDRTGEPDASLAFVPRFRVNAVEPTGAGDAFTAAAISRLIAHDWRRLTAEDVRYASAAGALATTKPGAMDALPSNQDVESFLAEHQQ